MLEWTTAAQAEKARGSEFKHYDLRLRGAQIVIAVAMVLLFVFRPQSSFVALPFFVLWIAESWIAYLTGRPLPRKERIIQQAQIPVLRGYAREIWRFYETLVDDQTHWLPPDNYQETPEPVVAPRTSPTNIGFLLLSNIAAYDLGYIGAVEFVTRTENTLETLVKLKTFNGHLFNWYSTENLEPLEPRYVSTVDSGNLVAALIVLKQFALRFGLNVKRTFEPRTGRYEGVRDTIQQFLGRVTKDSAFDKEESKDFG